MDKKLLYILLPGSHIFGQEKALITLACTLKESGIKIHFLIHEGWGSNIGEYLDSLNLTSSKLPMGTIWSLSMAVKQPSILWKNSIGVIKSSLRFYNLMKREKCSYFLTGNATFTFYILPALLLCKIPVIYRHGDDLTSHSLFHKILNKILFNRVNKNIVNCNYLKNLLEKKGIVKNSTIIYNLTTNYKDINKNQNCHKNLKNEFNILFIGQFSKHKGLNELFDAFNGIKSIYPFTYLHIAGEFPGVGIPRDEQLEKRINDMVSENKNRIVLHGRVSNPGYLYKIANLHICPSIYQEPSANVVMEAKSYGVPSIIFNVGGMPEIIENYIDGYICKEVSTESLIEGMKYYLKDSNRIISSSKAASINYEKKYNEKIFSEAWLKVFENI